MISRKDFSSGRQAMLVLMFAAVWWNWRSPWIFPLHFMSVMIHELGHGFASILTGGEIKLISLGSEPSGVCFEAGGIRWLVLPAGYLGSMAAGCAMVLVACRTRWDRHAMVFMGLGLVWATLLYVSGEWARFYGVGVGIALAASGRWLSEEFNDFILCFVGVTNMFYPLYGLEYLVSLGWKPGPKYHDAFLFSREVFPLPPSVWAGLWMLAALLCAAATFRLAAGGQPSPAKQPAS